jgi:glyoxylase-like metal-dependent hydrolase (beta-lactamase superfamily II)
MHLDHAGGLPDFPWAKVHIHMAEHAAIHNRKTLFERFCLTEHWAHGPDWVIHSQPTEDWFGLPAIPILPGIEPQIMMIHLPGHTKGLCGVVIRREADWLLLSSDSSYPMTPDHLGHPIIDWLSYPIVGGNIPRLREIIRQHGDQIQMVFGHIFPEIEMS